MIPDHLIFDLALVGSIFFFLWTGLVAVTGFLSDGMLATGQQIGALPSLMLSLACLVPAVILGLASGAVWFFFVRDTISSDTPSASPPSEVESYLTFVKYLLEREGATDIGSAVQARTLLVLQGVTAVDKVRVLKFLYNAGLINHQPIVSLKGVNFHQIDLSQSELPDIDLSGADLRAANLHEANLSGANLQGAVLQTADLRFTDLTRANLQTANLQAAKLHSSRLHEADLRGANIIEANLWRADLTAAQVTDEQLRTTKSLQEATLPDGSSA